jgi:hypothetical protein
VAEDSYVLRPDARRFEAWEANLGARLGLGAAVDHALEWGMSAIERRVIGLGGLLRERLASAAGITVHDRGRLRCGIATFSVAGHPAPEVVRRLREERINTSVAWAGSARLDLGRRGLDDVVRASVHYYNTEEEIDRLLEVLANLRSPSSGIRSDATGQAGTMSDPRTDDENRTSPDAESPADTPTAEPSEQSSEQSEQSEQSSDEAVPTGGNAAQAAAVFGVHSEAPVEMDSGGAG